MRPLVAVIVWIVLLAGPWGKAWGRPGPLESPFLTLGVIAQEGDPVRSVALFKDRSSSKTYAVRQGAAVGRGFVLSYVGRKAVHLKSPTGAILCLEVGAATMLQPGPVMGVPSSSSDGSMAGIERNGAEVRVSSALIDSILRDEAQFAKVLMQAATAPYYVAGKLQGFSFLEVDPGSVYSSIGLEDGDIVTAINGREITDVGKTLKQLQALRSEPEASLTVMRRGQRREMRIVVHQRS